MLAEDLVYCHSSGLCQNKAEIIDFVSSGKQRLSRHGRRVA